MNIFLSKSVFLLPFEKCLPSFAGMTELPVGSISDNEKPCLSPDKPVCRIGRGFQASPYSWYFCLLAC